MRIGDFVELKDKPKAGIARIASEYLDIERRETRSQAGRLVLVEQERSAQSIKAVRWPTESGDEVNCNCIQTIDEKLAERNLELDTTLLLGNGGDVTLSISTHWKDPAKKVRGQKLTTLVVNFCPFCGKSVEKE